MSGGLALGAYAVSLLRWQLHAAVRVRANDGHQLAVSMSDVRRVGLLPSERPDAWALSVPHRGSRTSLGPWFAWFALAGFVPRDAVDRGTTVIRGGEAMKAAGAILPKLNPAGGSAELVRSAVGQLKSVPEAHALFAAAARAHCSDAGFDDGWSSLRRLPAPLRLALEMASHEESERRALEGELAELERAWKEAEEIAAIADELLLPERVVERFRALGGRLGGAG